MDWTEAEWQRLNALPRWVELHPRWAAYQKKKWEAFWKQHMQKIAEAVADYVMRPDPLLAYLRRRR